MSLSDPHRDAPDPPAATGSPDGDPESRIFFGWWVVGGAFLVYFVSGGLFGTATVFFKALNAEFGWGRAGLSGAFSLGFVVAGFSAPLWGRIADRRGPRASFVAGALITGGLCILLSQISSLTSLYVLYVVLAFGSSGISLIPITVILSNWFVEKRGRAIGIAYTGVGVGDLVFAPAAGFLIERLGWRSAYAIAGIAVIALVTPVALWLRNRPEELGLHPDGSGPPPGGSALPAAGSPASGAAAGIPLAGAVRTPAFWLLALTWTVAMMPLSAVTLHQVPFLTDAGLSTQSAALAAGAVGGMSIPGRIGFGLLSEHFRIERLLAICYGMCGVGVALLWATESAGSPTLVLYTACFGVATGGSWALSALLVGEIFGVRALGEIFGLLGLAATIGGAVGGTGAGLLFDRSGSYDAVFTLCIALSWLGALLILFVRSPRTPSGPPLPNPTHEGAPSVNNDQLRNLAREALPDRARGLLAFLIRKRRAFMPVYRFSFPTASEESRESPYPFVVSSDNELDELGARYRPTKRRHNYLPYYWMHFRDIRFDVRNVLEIGIQTDRSIRMWEEFFPRATISGIDIDPRCERFEGGRRKMFVGDQSDSDFLRRVVRESGGAFDIVIDDGSHRVEHQRKSFEILFPAMSNHGIYVVEDTGGCVGDPELATVNSLKRLIDSIMYWPKGFRARDWMHLQEFPDGARWIDRNIIGIAFYRWIVFIMRGKNPRDNPFLTPLPSEKEAV